MSANVKEVTDSTSRSQDNASAAVREHRVLNSESDYVKLISAKAAGWIASADTKATALVTLLAVVLSLVSVGLGLKGKPSGWAFSLLVIFVIFTVGAIIACIEVIMPRTNRKAILPADSLEQSHTFFGDLAKLSFQKFKERCYQTRNEDISEDAIEQAFILNKIAATKMRCMQWAIWLTFISLVTLAILVIVSGLFGTKQDDTQRNNNVQQQSAAPTSDTIPSSKRSSVSQSGARRESIQGASYQPTRTHSGLRNPVR